MISSAALVQTKGLGSSFQCSAQSSMASMSSANGAEHPSAQPPVGEQREPALDQVEPPRAGGREVQVPAGLGRMGQPVGDLGRHVGGEVVEHHVDVEAAGHLSGRSS